MKRKIAIVLLVAVLIIAGGFFYIKYHFLKAKDFKPVTSKAKSIIDLRPSVIAKLQQVVKDGSNGLYILSIEKIDPDVLASKLIVVNAGIRIDTAAMLHLDSLKKLPDDIFKIHFDSLHIDGMGIEDLINKNSVEITGISISKPVIEVYHKTRAYNKAERKRNDTLSLYHRIKGRMNKISIGSIRIDNGIFITYDVDRKKKASKFNNITLRINDLLIDSSTQFDAKRFMFAKHATIDARNYMIPTPDSLYYFKTAAISIAAEQHTLTLHDAELNPRGNRRQFEGKLQFRKEMYHVNFPKVVLSGVDWWAIMNHESFIAKKGEITGGTYTIFLDRSLPKSPAIKLDNFPHQLLMKIPVPVSVNKLTISHVNVSYEEYNPDARQGATAFFDNTSNINTDIKKHPVATFAGTGLFMHHIPISARFTFDLSKYKTGDYSADVHMDKLDNLTINPIAEPLGLFSVKSGTIQQGTAHIDGNNFNAKCKIAMAYTDLHVKPLKKADENGQLKKKHMTGFFANVFLIKNANPIKGKELRQPDFSVERDYHANFFNVIWISILTGILKTIGVPVKFVIHGS
ncbi:MAG: hypothetical protein ABJA71_09970 [Ginsengibacter sp.]